MNNLKKLIKSFQYSFKGIQTALVTEFNVKVHFVVLIIVILLGLTIHLSNTEWLAIIGISALVISLEIVNTAIEELCDLISLDYNKSIEKIKDMSSAAVLISAIAAIVIGMIIFIPKFIN